MKKQLILFKGSDCAPCKMFEPIFDNLSDKYKEDYSSIKVVDDGDWMRKLGIRQVPTLAIALTDGTVKLFSGKDLRTKVIEQHL